MLLGISGKFRCKNCYNSTLQRPRSLLVPDDNILPSMDEDKAMADKAITFVVDFMADTLEYFAFLKKSAENCREKSRVAALEILDIDEASTDST